MSRELAEEQLQRAQEDILLYLDDRTMETTLAGMIDEFYPTPGYGRDIFGWAFWKLVNDGTIKYNNGQVRA